MLSVHVKQGNKILQGHLKYQFVFMIMVIKEFTDISKYKIWVCVAAPIVIQLCQSGFR